MNLAILKNMMVNIDTPAFLTDDSGRILFKNYHFKYIYDYIKNKEVNEISELDITRKKKDENIYTFKIGNTSLNGNEYILKLADGEYNLYLIERSFNAERIISDVIEHIDEIVVIFDEKGNITRMNSICDQLLPYKRDELIGRNINELVEKNLIYDSIIINLIKNKNTIYKDIVYPDGRVISYTAIPIFGKDKRFKGGVLTGRDLSRVLNIARTKNSSVDTMNDYISESSEMIKIKKMITRVAPSDASVFIMGESGVGKEVIAKTIVNQSRRQNKKFVAINCATIPTELIESELFGYEKGAFTGAKSEGKMGLIEAANGGTLFLDELGEMPLNTQKKLLRVIQENTIVRIGGITPRKVDVRYICATNKTLEELKDPNVFRQDLYYRLNVIPIMIPPLRERKDDIMPIANHYLEYFNERYNRNISLTNEAEEMLINYKWKGNIRELKNVIERIVVLSVPETITKENLERVISLEDFVDVSTKDEREGIREDIRANKKEYFINPICVSNDGIYIDDIVDVNTGYKAIEEQLMKNALIKCNNNISKAAKAIGLNPSTIYRKIKKGEIEI